MISIIVHRIRNKILLLSSLDNLHVKLQQSEDDGRTWTPSKDALDLDPQLNRPGWGFNYMGLPAGLQLASPSKSAGRLLGCASACMGGGATNVSSCQNRSSYAVYSDDGGKNWSMSAPIRGEFFNGSFTTSECSILQVPESSKLYFYSRTFYDAGCKQRNCPSQGLAESVDGGRTWSQARPVPGLPRFQELEASFASMRVTFPNGTSSTCFFVSRCMPTPKAMVRTNLSVVYSCGEGALKVWSDPIRIEVNSSSYSALLPRSDGQLLIMYAWGNSTHTNPMGCFWPVFPVNHSHGYHCAGGIQIAEVPLPWRSAASLRI